MSGTWCAGPTGTREPTWPRGACAPPSFALRKDLQAQAVTHADFLEALKETLPSVTEAMEREYAEVGKRLRQAVPQRGVRMGQYL